MRCPKCHYLSFDPEPRCRNCGYDLEVADADLALRGAESGAAPLLDLTLREQAPRPVEKITLELVHPEPPPEAATELRLSLADEPRGEPEPPAAMPTAAEPAIDLPVLSTPGPAPVPVSVPVEEPRRSPFRAPHTTAELPLFVKGIADRADLQDEGALDLLRQPAPSAAPTPRPPLAVRRAAPDPVRTRPQPAGRRLGPLDHDLLEDLKRVEREEAAQARAEAGAMAQAIDDSGDRVEPLQRFGAAAFDVAMLGGIAAFVFWATLRLCAVNLSSLGAGALVPLIAFLVIMDAGYLFMFTAAGGQTVGKMLMGIRVVADGTDDGHQVSIRQATWRAVLTIVSVTGLGLGWLPALFGRGLALHDRLAHTRVVRA